MNIFLPALLMGLLGSLHCIGMCGPIALALPFSTQNKYKNIFSILLYNLGRISMYALIGFTFGFFGEAFFIAGLQQKLSIVLGLAILFFMLIPKIGLAGNTINNKVQSILHPLYRTMSRLLEKKKIRVLFLLGLLNGLLPCGLIYLALAGALTMSSPGEGALFMVFFGLGTLPAMLSVPLMKSILNFELRKKLNRIYPAFMVTMGILLLVRGLNLGIPLISPKIEQNQNKLGSCCSESHCEIRTIPK